MKKIIIILMGILTLTTFGFNLQSSGINNGYILDKYGKHGIQNSNEMPTLSLPLEWKNPPKGTKAYAIVMQDYDAVPVVGFSWIHWTAIVPSNFTKLDENASQMNKSIIQGVNSWASPLGNMSKSNASFFGGPAPPDKEHKYEIKIYALSQVPKLENGFYLNQLYSEIKGNILGEAILEGNYRN